MIAHSDVFAGLMRVEIGEMKARQSQDAMSQGGMIQRLMRNPKLPDVLHFRVWIESIASRRGPMMHEEEISVPSPSLEQGLLVEWIRGLEFLVSV